MPPRTPVAREQNPVLLWLYANGLEDPTWGQTKVGQLVRAVAVYELAGGIADPEIATAIQAPAQRAVAKLSKELVAKPRA